MCVQSQARFVFITRTAGIIGGVLVSVLLTVTLLPSSAHNEIDNKVSSALRGLLRLQALVWQPLVAHELEAAGVDGDDEAAEGGDGAKQGDDGAEEHGAATAGDSSASAGDASKGAAAATSGEEAAGAAEADADSGLHLSKLQETLNRWGLDDDGGAPDPDAMSTSVRCPSCNACIYRVAYKLRLACGFRSMCREHCLKVAHKLVQMGNAAASCHYCAPPAPYA